MKVRLLFFAFILAFSWQCNQEKVFNRVNAEALIEQMKLYPKIKHLKVDFFDVKLERVIINEQVYSFSKQYIQNRQELGYQVRPIGDVYSDFNLTVEALQELRQNFEKINVQSYTHDKGSFLLITDSFNGDFVGYLKSDQIYNNFDWKNLRRYVIRGGGKRVEADWWSIQGTY